MKHFYQSIPGWFSFRALYEQAVREAQDGAHFVEVGSWKGRSAAFMAVEIINSGKKIRFDCVDTWQGSQEKKHQDDASVKSGTLYQDFCRNLSEVRHIGEIALRLPAPWPNVKRMMSLHAAATYTDNSLDFVFIDAAHDYANVLADVRAWWPKVKPGGVIAGDDYAKESVKRGVLGGFSGESVWIQRIKGSGTGWQWKVKKDADDSRLALA